MLRTVTVMPIRHICFCSFVWATVCKTVRPILSAVVCLSDLSVTLVHCSQTVGWIKMPLGIEVWPRSRPHCQTGTQLPTERGTAAPTFRPMSIVAKRLDGSSCHLVRRSASPRPHCVRWGPSSPPHRRSTAAAKYGSGFTDAGVDRGPAYCGETVAHLSYTAELLLTMLEQSNYRKFPE